MQGSRLGLIAAVALLAGSAGCSLPHVLPLEGNTSSGPSPYGVWYEQHWATNSVLLAASDQPEETTEAPADTVIGVGDPEVSLETEANIDGDIEAAAREAREAADEAAAAANSVDVKVEASAGSTEQFDNSSPYQFPASSFQPGAAADPVPADGNAPVPDGPIRY